MNPSNKVVQPDPAMVAAGLASLYRDTIRLLDAACERVRVPANELSSWGRIYDTYCTLVEKYEKDEKEKQTKQSLADSQVTVDDEKTPESTG